MTTKAAIALCVKTRILILLLALTISAGAAPQPNAPERQVVVDAPPTVSPPGARRAPYTQPVPYVVPFHQWRVLRWLIWWP